MTDGERNQERTLGRIEAMCNDMHHALFGNGQPGIVSRLSKLEHEHSTCHQAHQTEAKSKDKWLDKKFAVMMMLASIIAGIVIPAIMAGLKFIIHNI